MRAKLVDLLLEVRVVGGEQMRWQAEAREARIIAIEAARYAPSLELAFKIASAFRRPIEEVFQYH